jgi:hypothetical protein
MTKLTDAFRNFAKAPKTASYCMNNRLDTSLLYYLKFFVLSVRYIHDADGEKLHLATLQTTLDNRFSETSS